MYSRRAPRPRNNRAGIKHKHIDLQVLALHKAMGEKLLAQPQLAEQVRQTVESRYRAGRLRHGAYLTWCSLLEHLDDAESFMTYLMEDSERMRKLRRQTPLVGILTETERQQVLTEFACGTTTVETLL